MKIVDGIRSPSERGILFSGSMVRALLAGCKTQTRRVINPQPTPLPADVVRTRYDTGWWWPSNKALSMVNTIEMRSLGPYGEKGDLLWVRESHWRFTGCANEGKPWEGFVEAPHGNPYQARCYDDYFNLDGARGAAAVVRVPSIHMPRWASRITLEITDIRVERVQEISGGDATAEGVGPLNCYGPDCPDGGNGCNARGCLGAREGFHRVWDSINAERGYGWDVNPWVWVVTFRRLPNVR